MQEGLSSISIDPDRALLEWLQALGGRVSGRVLASSGTFQYFAAAAPGAKELVYPYVLGDFSKEEMRWVEVVCEATARSADLLASGQDASFQNKTHLAIEAAGFGETSSA